MATIGYVRGNNQNDINSFTKALLEEGVERIYIDNVNGFTPIADRKELSELINHLKEGDVILIQVVDRISRDVQQILEIINIVSDKGANIKLLNSNDFLKKEDMLGDFLSYAMQEKYKNNQQQ